MLGRVFEYDIKTENLRKSRSALRDGATHTTVVELEKVQSIFPAAKVKRIGKLSRPNNMTLLKRDSV